MLQILWRIIKKLICKLKYPCYYNLIQQHRIAVTCVATSQNLCSISSIFSVSTVKYSEEELETRINFASYSVQWDKMFQGHQFQNVITEICYELDFSLMIIVALQMSQ